MNICSVCDLYNNVKSPKMEPSGEGKTGVLLFGESPGETEDKEGRQFVGKAGKRLRRYIIDEGYEPALDFWFYNCVNCRTMDSKGKNRTPNDKEIEYCLNQTIPKILELKPKVILSLGGTPLKIFCNNHLTSKSKKTISGVRGLPFVSQQFNCWIVPTFHPSYLDRNLDDIELGKTFLNNIELEKIFLRDFRLAMNLIGQRDKLEARLNIGKSFSYSTNRFEIQNYFNNLFNRREKRICIDYETTGLNAYSNEEKVISVAISDGVSTVVFMIEDYIDLFIELLCFSYLDKIAQSAGFEDKWSRRLIKDAGKDVGRFVPFSQDILIKSFLLNGRVGVNNLEFLVWRYFGIEFKGEVDRTKIVREAEGALLKYNAQDAFYTYWLNEEFDKEIENIGGKEK